MFKLLITGGNGQLGRAINNLYTDREDIECINTDVGELDITNLEEVIEFVDKCRPYAIVNCAAHTAVDLCEDQVDAAYKINAIGPRNLSIAAEKFGCKIMQISTDYVFSGNASRPYTEFDAPAPQGVYGASKLAGENFVKEFSSKYFIIRTAWLYGDGKNFVRTMLRLSKDHDEVRVVNDQFGTPTSTAELVKAIDSIMFTRNYGIYHATCEGSCNWAEFASEIFKLAGKDTKVIGISTAEYGAPANRPAHSILENRMLKAVGGYTFCDWHDAIKTYLEQELK